eukprot:m.22049 g.22049  ORF g.22049 m.22049 type:complete len:190 (+) comp12842_c0_seq1:43-612(+)
MTDEDVALPKAAVLKYIKELSPSLRVTSEVRDLVVDCCTELIHLLTTEAEEICAQRKKTQITPDDLLGAMEKLEMPDFLDPAKEALNNHKKEAKEKRTQKKERKKNQSQHTPEELEKMQEALFAKAAAKYKNDNPTAQPTNSPSSSATSAPTSSIAEPTAPVPRLKPEDVLVTTATNQNDEDDEDEDFD